MGDPLTASLALGAVGQVVGLNEQHKARKQAKADREEDQKNQKFANLINVLQGGQARTSQTQPLPQVGFGNALTGIGDQLGGYANAQAAQSNTEAARIQKDLDRKERVRQFNVGQANDLAIAGTRAGNKPTARLPDSDIQHIKDLISK